MYDNDKSELLREDSLGVASIYDYGCCLMVVAGWTLFVSIFIVIEITRAGRLNNDDDCYDNGD